ncbi:hypothetical protein SUDANB23_06747 (plasmid) [Streptomyces sp. enrichment culture]
MPRSVRERSRHGTAFHWLSGAHGHFSEAPGQGQGSRRTDPGVVPPQRRQVGGSPVPATFRCVPNRTVAVSAARGPDPSSMPAVRSVSPAAPPLSASRAPAGLRAPSRIGHGAGTGGQEVVHPSPAAAGPDPPMRPLPPPPRGRRPRPARPAATMPPATATPPRFCGSCRAWPAQGADSAPALAGRTLPAATARATANTAPGSAPRLAARRATRGQRAWAAASSWHPPTSRYSGRGHRRPCRAHTRVHRCPYRHTHCIRPLCRAAHTRQPQDTGPHA